MFCFEIWEGKYKVFWREIQKVLGSPGEKISGEIIYGRKIFPWERISLRYFFKDKQNAVKNEVQMPCGRSKLQGKAIISKIKPFPLLVLCCSYSKLLKFKNCNEGCLRYLQI